MKVTLLNNTPHPEATIAAAAKLCYSNKSIHDLTLGVSDDDAAEFIDRLMSLGHESPIEHVTFTFGIEGISRACYDLHTMVLTNHGWKFFKDVDIHNDLICSMNDNHEIEYVKAIDNISYKYKGMMDVYKSSQVDLVVTPNHNMWLYDHEKRSEKTKTWKFIKSEDVVNCRYGFDKTSDGINNPGLKELVIPPVKRNHHKISPGHVFTEGNINLFLELLGIWVTDGYLSYGTTHNGVRKTGNRVFISQIKQFGRKRIEHLLQKLNIHYRKSPVAFIISDQALFDWLVKNFINGKDTHKTYYLKLPRWMFTDLSKYNIMSFIDGVFIGNGSHHVYTHEYLIKNHISIFTTGSGFNIATGSNNFANDLVELSLLAGLCANKRLQKARDRIFPGGRYVKCKPLIVVSILNNGYHLFRTKENKSQIYYNDMVYCLELEKYHRLYVMRNGRPCWCGNCSHQLVRHRIASYSQKSQRYVNETQFDYVTPHSIENIDSARDRYEHLMTYIQVEYNSIRDELINYHIDNDGMDPKMAEKAANEDARMVLPNACCTSIIVTMNVRSLFNFFKHRCCNRAQWEIREIADEMYKLCYMVAPNIFKYAGPGCVTGRCTEGKMSCGKTAEMIKHFKDLVKNE